MFLNLLFSKLKNFYYKNMVKTHPTLMEVYKFNRVTKDELIQVCNISLEYFDVYDKNCRKLNKTVRRGIDKIEEFINKSQIMPTILPGLQKCIEQNYVYKTKIY